MKKVLLTTYLTKKGDPQRTRSFGPDDSALIDNWYKGAKKYTSVVFHDELSDEFIAKYPKVEFVRVEDYKYSANDGRFQMFKDYIDANPKITTVFMTDMFDVTVNKYPTNIDKLRVYAQREPRRQPEIFNSFWRNDSRWARKQFERLYSGEPDLLGKSIYNPGVWGGHRVVVLHIINLILAEFQRINVGEKNGNMLVFNKVLYHEVGEENIISGYPLHSRFRYYETDSDACFIHK